MCHCGGRQNQENYYSIPYIGEVRDSQKRVLKRKEKYALRPGVSRPYSCFSERHLPLCLGPCFSENKFSVDCTMLCNGQIFPKNLPDEST